MKHREQKPRILSKKICMLGTFGVGKTSLVRRFVYSVFEEKYLSTLGVQISQKQLTELGPNSRKVDQLNLILWDLANVEKFTAAVKNYYRGAAGAIIVTDLTRRESCDEMRIHLREFLETNPDAVLIFAGNKVDLVREDDLPRPELQELAAKYRAAWLRTSAKTGENVQELFEKMGEQLLGC